MVAAQFVALLLGLLLTEGLDFGLGVLVGVVELVEVVFAAGDVAQPFVAAGRGRGKETALLVELGDEVVVDDVDEHEAAFVQAEVVALADGRPLGLEEEAATGGALVHLVEVVAGCAVSGLFGGCRAGGGGNGMDRFHPLRVSRFLRRRIITY